MTIKEFNKKYPNKIWIVAYATPTMYHDAERAFLNESEAREFYDSLDNLKLRDIDRRIYQVNDIWNLTERLLKKKAETRGWI